MSFSPKCSIYEKLPISHRTRRAIRRWPRLEIDMRRTTLAVALAFALSLAACSTTPTAPPHLDLPAATSNDPALERWWSAFDDATLTALVDEALAKNLDLRAAISRIDSARAQVTLAQGDLYPKVNLGLAATRSRNSEVGPVPLPGLPPVSN